MHEKIPVYLCHTNILSGVTTWGLELRAAFKEHEKYEFILVNLWRDPDEKFDLNLNNIRTLYEKIGKNGPAIVLPNYVWRIYDELPLVKPMQFIRFVGVCHSDTYEEYYEPLTRIEPQCAKFIGVSPTCTATLGEKIPHRVDDIVTLPYGISVPEYLHRDYQCNPIRLVYAGRVVHQQKRVFDFVNLVKELENQRVNYTFDIIGDGLDLDELKSRLEKENLIDKVCFRGKVDFDTMSQLWPGYDIFVQVSDYEGTSLSLLEAIAHGVVPVVSDASSGVRSVISHGESGFISSVGDQKTMAEQISYLAQNPDVLSAAGNAAYANASTYSVERYLERFFELLDQVASTMPPYTKRRIRLYQSTHKVSVFFFRLKRKVRHVFSKVSRTASTE